MIIRHNKHMKYKYILMLVAILTLTGATMSYGLIAKAEDNNVGNDSVSEVQQKQNEAVLEAQKKQMESTREAEKKNLEGAPESVKKAAEAKWETEKKQFETNREANKKINEASSTESENTDENKYEDDDANGHKDAVSGFVHDLLSIASTTNNHDLGEEVRNVAKEQNDNKDKTAEAINQVKNRNALMTLLIGADFKNLGELRSSIVTTDNHINRLNEIKSKASSTPEVQSALGKEVQTLNAEKERLNNIVKDNESKFSMFGWLFKMFQ